MKGGQGLAGSGWGVVRSACHGVAYCADSGTQQPGPKPLCTGERSWQSATPKHGSSPRSRSLYHIVPHSTRAHTSQSIAHYLKAHVTTCLRLYSPKTPGLETTNDPLHSTTTLHKHLFHRHVTETWTAELTCAPGDKFCVMDVSGSQENDVQRNVYYGFNYGFSTNRHNYWYTGKSLNLISTTKANRLNIHLMNQTAFFSHSNTNLIVDFKTNEFKSNNFCSHKWKTDQSGLELDCLNKIGYSGFVKIW